MVRMRALVTTLIVALIGVASVIGISDASAAPAPPDYADIALLPVGATLPSDAECAARVHRSTWEPRAGNTPRNLTKATSAEVAAFQAATLEDYDSVGNGPN